MISQQKSVRECVTAIKEGTLTSEKLVAECLDHIEATDKELKAWVFLDREYAMDQAKNMDDLRRRGKPTGALHGIPVGIKDIFDVAGIPNENGSPIYKGNVPEQNCTVVDRLVEAGAVIMGKTATTEFAHMHPTKTRNPHNQDHGPGGSSSGSAAAVAAGHVPLALGSQTGGSTIRPASYCGIYGFKPSRGIISRKGVFQTSSSLDQVGLFGRNPGDVALLCDVLGGYDREDCASYIEPRPEMLEGYNQDVPIDPSLVWIDLPYADRYSDSVIGGCDELIELLGDRIERITAPISFQGLIVSHKTIYDFELYRCLEQERLNHWDLVSPEEQSNLEQGANVSQEDYDHALEVLAAANDWFQQFFYDYDAILTPSAVAEAPKMGEGTGDPICCTIWTLSGLPCLSLPLLTGENDLPIGIQLIAGYNEDDRLMRTSRWLINQLDS